MNPSAKQYNYMWNFNHSNITEIKSKLKRAVKHINDGRNLVIESLTHLDSIHHVSNQLKIFDSENSKKAARFFVDQKLGYDYSPEMIWNYKKKFQEIDYTYDPKLATSKRTSIPTKPKDAITFKWVVPYHIQKEDIKFE